MRELRIELHYDAHSVEKIGEGDDREAMLLGWKISDMLRIFTLHAKSPDAATDDKYIVVCENDAAWYDITRDGRSLLDSDERYRLHLAR